MPSASKAKSRGKKKAYWLETQGELVASINLTNGDEFDHNAAFELVKRWLETKPVCRFKLHCVADGLKLNKASTFGSSPARKMYMFNDIQRFYQFNDYPAILVLACVNPEKMTKHYDVFKFENHTVQDVCELIDRAHSHPMHILVDDGKGLVRYHSSHSSLAGEPEISDAPTELIQSTDEPIVSSEFTPMDEHAMDPELENKRKSTVSIKDHRASMEHSSPSARSFTAPVPRSSTASAPRSSTAHVARLEHRASSSSNSSDEIGLLNKSLTKPAAVKSPERTRKRSPIPKHMLNDPLFSSLCENLNEDDLWSVDMKYIGKNSKNGNQICQTGGVYIFVAHHKPANLVTNIKGNRRSSTSSDEEKLKSTADFDFTVTYAH